MNHISTKLCRCLRHKDIVQAYLGGLLGFRTSTCTSFHSRGTTPITISDSYPCKLFTSHNATLRKTVKTSAVCLQKPSVSDSQDIKDNPAKDSPQSNDPIDDPKEEGIGLFKRFRKAYKEHGKVLIVVHCVTSSVWFGAFFYAAASGFDLTPLLQKIGAADRIIELANSSVGNLATAYLMYKLATPARYTVTLFGTYTSVKYLQQLGYIEPPQKRDNLRTLMKDGRSQMKDRYEDLKDDVKEKMDDMKDAREKLEDKIKKRKS